MRGKSAAALPLCLLAIACSDSTGTPAGKGDTLIVDVDATGAGTAQPPPQSDADAPLDGPYGALFDASYAFAACEACKCPAGTFCFGGGSTYGVLGTTCTGATGAGGVPLGCTPMPAACSNEPDCDCLIKALSPSLSCYTICTEASGFTVRCP